MSAATTLDPKIWADLQVKGYVASAVKGNPSRVHARKVGAAAAICCKKPGPGSGGSMLMKNRVGWMYWPTGGTITCEACIEIAAKGGAA